MTSLEKLIRNQLIISRYCVTTRLVPITQGYAVPSVEVFITCDVIYPPVEPDPSGSVGFLIARN